MVKFQSSIPVLMDGEVINCDLIFRVTGYAPAFRGSFFEPPCSPEVEWELLWDAMEGWFTPDEKSAVLLAADSLSGDQYGRLDDLAIAAVESGRKEAEIDAAEMYADAYKELDLCF